MIDFVDDRPGHDFRYAINSEKLKSLGWTPKANFDDELEKIVDWYIKNKDWWSGLIHGVASKYPEIDYKLVFKDGGPIQQENIIDKKYYEKNIDNFSEFSI